MSQGGACTLAGQEGACRPCSLSIGLVIVLFVMSSMAMLLEDRPEPSSVPTGTIAAHSIDGDVYSPDPKE